MKIIGGGHQKGGKIVTEIPSTLWVILHLTFHARSSAINTPSGAHKCNTGNASLPTLQVKFWWVDPKISDRSGPQILQGGSAFSINRGV